MVGGGRFSMKVIGAGIGGGRGGRESAAVHEGVEVEIAG